MISVRSLDYHYPGAEQPVLSGLSLEVKRGDRFGLFGPNGAGKTTLMSLMTGILPVKPGQVFLDGIDISTDQAAARKLFGLVPQDFAFYQELSPEENLHFFGAWSGLSSAVTRRRTNELLNIMGLEAVRARPVQQFSGGMKRRVNLAIGVIHEPALLFLDEPTVGVDVQTGFAIVSYLKELNARGTTLVYTSHQLGEAEALCDRVALIDQGHIIAAGTLPALLSDHRQEDLEGLFLRLTGHAYRND